METIDLTDGFALKWIAQIWENLSAQYSMDQRSIFSLGDRFGTPVAVFGRAPTEFVHRGLDLTVLTPDD
jgi:hypothetical protein